jgi:hypothetical protein
VAPFAADGGSAWRLGQAEHHDTLVARNNRIAIGDAVTVRVRRAGAERGEVVEQFEVPYQKWMRVLDVLNWVAEHGAISRTAGFAAPKCAAPARCA